MFVAYARMPDGETATFNSPDDLSSYWANDSTFLWIDLENPTEDEICKVDSVIQLDSEAWGDCRQGDQRARIDEYENYLFSIVYGLRGVEDDSDLHPRKLGIFCGERFVVTVHEESLKTISQLRKRCNNHSKSLMQNGPDHLLYHIIDGIVDNYLYVAMGYEEHLEELEDLSEDFEMSKMLLGDISALRRDLLELRRLVLAQQMLIGPITSGEYDYISEALGQKFTHVRDHLLKVLDHVDGLRELLNGIRDNYNIALANRTNDIMRTLTIFASIMLPLSLIAGIYGMNVHLWPSSEHAGSFWFIVGIMIVITGLLFWFFRRKKWL